MNLQSFRKTTFILIIILAIALIGLFILSLILQPESYNQLLTSLQKTKVGQTTDKDIENLEVINKEATAGGYVYTVNSVDPLTGDQIITKDGVVVFEKTSTFTNEPGGFPKISEYLKKFGEPVAEMTGSKTHGAFATYYIYPQKGITFVGNEATDKIYELQRYLPLSSVEEYLNTYGQDVNTGGPIHEHE